MHVLEDPLPLEWFQDAQESGAESQRGTWVLWVCATQGNDLGSPRCCSDEERSKNCVGTQATVAGIFIYALM